RGDREGHEAGGVDRGVRAEGEDGQHGPQDDACRAPEDHDETSRLRRASQRADGDGQTDDDEGTVEEAEDEPDRLGTAAAETVAEQVDLQSDEVRNHARPSTSVVPPTRST